MSCCSSFPNRQLSHKTAISDIGKEARDDVEVTLATGQRRVQDGPLPSQRCYVATRFQGQYFCLGFAEALANQAATRKNRE